MELAAGVYFLVFGIILVLFANQLSDIALRAWGSAFATKPSKRMFLIFFYPSGIVFVLGGLRILLIR